MEEFLNNSFMPIFVNQILTSSQSEIIIQALNILTYLPLNFWLHDSDLDRQIFNKLLKISDNFYIEQSTSQLKVVFFRVVGQLVYQDWLIERNWSIFLSFFDKQIQIGSQQNIHVQEKMSWALANLCSGLNDLCFIQNNRLIDIIQYQMYLSQSKKEKLVTNGFRGLGYLFKKVKQDIYQNQDEREIFFNKVIHGYVTQMANKNAKIVWNAIYSLNNTLLTKWKELKQYILGSTILKQSILVIISNRDSLKILIHAYELLLTIESINPNLWEQNILHQALQLLSDLSTMQTFLEQRYFHRLRWLSFQLIECVMNKTDLNSINNICHDYQILQCIIEEVYALLEYQGKQCKHHQLIWARPDVPKDKLYTENSESKQDKIPVSQKSEETETATNVKYLKIDFKQEEPMFVKVLQVIQNISKRMLDTINDSDLSVNFILVQALEELGQIQPIINDTMIIKLQIT